MEKTKKVDDNCGMQKPKHKQKGDSKERRW